MKSFFPSPIVSLFVQVHQLSVSSFRFNVSTIPIQTIKKRGLNGVDAGALFANIASQPHHGDFGTVAVQTDFDSVTRLLRSTRLAYNTSDDASAIRIRRTHSGYALSHIRISFRDRKVSSQPIACYWGSTFLCELVVKLYSSPALRVLLTSKKL